jgi:hypothetical protein
MENMQISEKKDIKRSLLTTFALLGAMIATSPRKKEEEEASQGIRASIFNPQWEGSAVFQEALKELNEKGFVDESGTPTKFGQRVALTATQNAPNFTNLAQNNISTAFAMLFAAKSALAQFIGENSIDPGGKSGLYESCVDVQNFLNEKISKS